MVGIPSKLQNDPNADKRKHFYFDISFWAIILANLFTIFMAVKDNRNI
jgi:hypothetical protein